MLFAAIFELLVEESARRLYSTTTKSGRTQGFFDCTAGEDAFLAGCEVLLVGTKAVEITEGTTRDGQ
jgi:hypothetical protein